MQTPGSLRVTPSASSAYVIDTSSEIQPLLDSDDDDVEDHVSISRTTQWDRHVEPSLATVQPRAWQGVTAFRQQFIRQILGLNPFSTSYFALYRPLNDTGSRSVLALGILLAVAAGIPLRTQPM